MKKKRKKTGPAPKAARDRSVKLSITVPREIAEAAEDAIEVLGSISGFFQDLYYRKRAR